MILINYNQRSITLGLRKTSRCLIKLLYNLLLEKIKANCKTKISLPPKISIPDKMNSLRMRKEVLLSLSWISFLVRQIWTFSLRKNKTKIWPLKLEYNNSYHLIRNLKMVKSKTSRPLMKLLIIQQLILTMRILLDHLMIRFNICASSIMKYL